MVFRLRGLLCKLDAVVGEDRADPVWQQLKEMLQELPCRPPVGLVDEPGDRELAHTVDCYEEKKGLPSAVWTRQCPRERSRWDNA